MNNNNLDISLIVNTFKQLNLKLSDKMVNQFLEYYSFLIERNRVMNLTAITDYEDVVLKHFADSLSIVKAYDMEGCSSMIDVGTGAGFPGLPIKIVFPHLNVTLLDSLNKRISFLNELIERLQLEGVTTVHMRAEDAARNSLYREKFDLCVSRAVANLSSLSEYCLPFVRKSGMFISYKSSDIDKEISSSDRAIKLLGGEIKRKAEFCLPDSEIGRSLILIEKTGKTPSRYPRKAGIPSKEPL